MNTAVTTIPVAIDRVAHALPSDTLFLSSPVITCHQKGQVDVLAQPIGDRLLVELTRGDSEHQVHGVVGGDFETMAVEGEEDGQRLPREPLVAVGQWVVARDSDDQHCCLLDERRIELLVVEARLGRVERRVQQLDS